MSTVKASELLDTAVINFFMIFILRMLLKVLFVISANLKLNSL